MSLKPKLRSWRFLRYWRFNKWYHGGYQLICLISRPILIASRCDWYQLKGLSKGFPSPLRPWESLKNWWRYGQMKFVTEWDSIKGLQVRQSRESVEVDLYTSDFISSLLFFRNTT